MLLCPLISPLNPSIPDGGEAVELLVDMKDAVFDDKIIGTEATTMSEHGPGAIEPRQLPTPHRMLPSKEAKHWLTHLPYDPACELCVQCQATQHPPQGIQKGREDDTSTRRRLLLREGQ